MPSTSNIFPVVMCGGSGTRLWPASRPPRSKQFMALVSERSLFRETVDRVRRMDNFRQLVVVAGVAHEGYIAAELAGLDIETVLLLEPEGRDSAAAIAAAAVYVEQQDPDGIAVVVASDHHIPDAERFRADLKAAASEAENGGIVMLGIVPAFPSAAYGYIQPGFSEGTCGPVASFTEKPDVETAATYIERGYLWNSGNFIARAATLTDAFANYAPDTLSAAKGGLDAGNRNGSSLVLGAPFLQAPKISFDYAVMESFDNRHVVRSGIQWSDLGDWGSVHDALPKDGNGNSTFGDALLIDATNNHARTASGTTVVLAGVDGLNVVVEDDVVLVTRLDRSQMVKSIVDTLRRQGRTSALVAGPPDDLAALSDKWTKWLDTSVLPLWWSNGFDHVNGLWRENLSSDRALPTGDNTRSRVQGRQSYVYAMAGQRGWVGPWKQALQGGLTAIDRHYVLSDGLMRTCADASGNSVDDAVLLYDQTFHLLALSAAHDVLADTEAQALTLLLAMEQRFARADGGSGWREDGPHPFQANAHMHLFEAALAWMKVGTDGRWADLANGIAGLALGALRSEDGRFIREFYEADWSPESGADGKRLEPGHQFEWSSLLLSYSRIANDTNAREFAEHLFQTGIRGVDPRRVVAVDAMNLQFRPLSATARLWPQTEWLKASVAFALSDDLSGSSSNKTGKRAFYERQITRAALACDRFFSAPVRGLWYDRMLEDGDFEWGPAPASSLYHVVGAIEALERWNADNAG